MRRIFGKNKLLIDSFIEKIVLVSKSSDNLEEKTNSINELLINIIDYCIKKNIYFFIKNKIKYTTINNIFKNNLINYIKDIINDDNSDIIKYIDTTEDLNNFSDINSLLLNEYKKEENTKVSFRDNISLVTDNTNYDKNNSDNSDNSNNSDNSYNKKKYSVKHVKLSDTVSNNNQNNLSLHIILLVSQNNSLIIDKFKNELLNITENLCNCNNQNDFTNIFSS
jgi:hypothetical protein